MLVAGYYISYFYNLLYYFHGLPDKFPHVNNTQKKPEAVFYRKICWEIRFVRSKYFLVFVNRIITLEYAADFWDLCFYQGFNIVGL